MRSRARWAPALVALAALALAALPAAGQPYARFAGPDSVLAPAVKASGAQFENAWNALLVAELRATLARADSAARLLALARRVAGAEAAALGSHIAEGAMRLRARWTPEQRRQRVEAAVAESAGTAARDARDFDRADSLLGAALRRYERLGEARRVAWVWGTLGATAFAREDLVAADSLYRQALAARRAIGDDRMVGNALNTLGSVAYRVRRYDDAWRFYQEARAVREQTGERSALGSTLGLLANVAVAQGWPDSAAVYFRGALALTVAQGDSARTFDVVQNLGHMLSVGASPGSALPWFERALTIARQRESAAGQANALTGMGDVLRRQGHFTAALARLEEARDAAAAARDPELLRGALLTAGQVRLNLGDAVGARPPLERALAIADSLGDRDAQGAAYDNLSILAGMEDDPKGAERLGGRALDAAVAAGDSILVNSVTASLGGQAIDRGDFAAAQAWFTRSMAAATEEGQRFIAIHNLGVVASLSNHLDQAEAHFTQALTLARRAGAPDFEWPQVLGLGDVAERRGQFAVALAFDRQAAESIEGLRAEQGAEHQSVALLSERLYAFEALIHLLTRLQPRYPDSAYAAEAFHWSERARARALLDLVAASGGTGSRARPLTLAEAQGLLASDREALLAYSTSDSSTSLWVVKRRAWTHLTLPPRKALRARIEILRRGLADPATAEAKGTRTAARALYRALVEPALPALKGVDHLIVAPDGPLALVPFEALLAADAIADGPAPRGAYLVERYAISYTPSASALATRSGAGAGTGIVALGDPAFAAESTDAGPRLAALPNTAAEVTALGALAGRRPIATLTGRDATRDRLLGLEALPRAALIHVATHGEANQAEPERSGLWMAAAADGSGPGFVSVSDILGLHLGADLVTLSACETGLGRVVRGEGVIGLTRAFLAAGAQSVMVSLWKVNDRSTAVLMERFYRGLLGQGEPGVAALAQAKRALIADPAMRSPFYWAPFVLVGSAGRLTEAR
ncbi:MAG: CHAT domain-containing protein [Candidatus Eisenbacteria bacterium]|uniref:CHAT domain-containing protein n=1 Tax=Eiseniibacteriota bacterium TaxID=2212470 RepID=A0A538UE77_UNCEI|nr:MAG: CHAT domain-containing protein [Candidatus Eisenbacteria bacterium]